MKTEVTAAVPVLAVRNLTTAFRGDGVWTTVVKGISFDIGPRETVAIVGESGSGKSVTALSIMGLLPAANSQVRGEILLEGRELLKLREDQMRKVRGNLISMIFQEPMTSLNPVLTLGFQITEALIYHRSLNRAQAEAETLRILERVRIPSARSRLHEYPHRLSGGMRQRVMIAMALACRPKLLIADEPTTALDVTIQAEILELINLLQDEEGMSVAFITHDMGVVAEIADRTVVMLNGHAVEQAPTARLFASPRAPYPRARPAPFPPSVSLMITVATTSVVWISVTLLTAPTDRATLVSFYRLVRPAGRGWEQIRAEAGVAPSPDSIPQMMLAWTTGCVFVYSALFGTGSFVYGHLQTGALWTVLFAVSGVMLFKLMRRMFA